MKDTKNKRIGYVFGFKETTKSDDKPNTFHVGFYRGSSESFPTRFRDKKDFYADEIRAGDFSPLFIDLDLAKKAFEAEIQEMEKDRDFWSDVLEERNHFFELGPHDMEQFIALTASSMLHLHFPHQTFETDEIGLKFTADLISSAFEKSAHTPEDIVRDFLKGTAEAYDAELNRVIKP